MHFSAFALASKKTYPWIIAEQRTNGHSVLRLTTHLVWSTKYRYCVLEGDIQIRCCALLIQIFDAEDVQILKRVVSEDHVHVHIEYRRSMSWSYLVKKLKGRSSGKLQREFPVLKSKYWRCHFWVIGYGCWSTGNITDKMVNEYLEHHRKLGDGENTNFILE